MSHLPSRPAFGQVPANGSCRPTMWDEDLWTTLAGLAAAQVVFHLAAFPSARGSRSLSTLRSQRRQSIFRSSLLFRRKLLVLFLFLLFLAICDVRVLKWCVVYTWAKNGTLCSVFIDFPNLFKNKYLSPQRQNKKKSIFRDNTRLHGFGPGPEELPPPFGDGPRANRCVNTLLEGEQNWPHWLAGWVAVEIKGEGCEPTMVAIIGKL